MAIAQDENIGKENISKQELSAEEITASDNPAKPTCDDSTDPNCQIIMHPCPRGEPDC